ncbi:transmembrane protein 135-like isoform X2 [Mizuhopecten yessoensis]|uniref:transmembrane protein 135-like isoform X2 n=1 Tax=Mizuhopecten yessoensis TaxID=6573 RepID=UPI000B45C38D|nr:transmembrane protein 135-like isoform X2 [Mizuhopecten yessoensis]
MVVFGKPTSVPFTCYELGHTWSPSCVKASLGVSFDVFKEALKIYGSLYLIAGIVRKRGKKYFQKKWLAETGQSTLFLTTNGTLFLVFFCLWRKLTGFYIFLNVFLCGIPACAMSVSIERKDRRGLLAIYMANVATETFYRMAMSRGWVGSLPHGEVLLFSAATAIYLYLFKRNSLPSSTISAFRFLVGKDELPASVLDEEPTVRPSSQSRIIGRGTRFTTLQPVLSWLQNQSKHRLCKHHHSCVYYVLKGFTKMFGLGFVIQGGIKVVSALPRLVKNPSALLQAVKHRDNFKLAAFLGCFNAVFRAVNCCLRHIRNSDSDIHGLLAGVLAGWSMLWYKSVTAALYTAFKLAEVLYFKGIEKNLVPYIRCADIIIYSISTAFVFHTAVVEPHNLRPAYWNFLLRVTDNKFALMNRQLMEPFVPGSSKLFPGFWPNYDSRFTSLVRPADLIKS